MNDPFLSIIIPVFNVRNYLAEALDSVCAAADRLPFGSTVQVICVDDGSTDGSSEFLDEYAQHAGCRVAFVVVHQQNAGVSAARNVGLDCATGDWIGFVDGDDCVDVLLFSWLSDVLLSHPDLEVACFGGMRVDEKLKPLSGLTSEFPDAFYASGDVLLCDARCARWMSGIWDKFYRRTFLQMRNLRFETAMKYDEDTLFAKLCLAQCSAVFVSSAMKGYLYRMRSTSAIHQKCEHMPIDPLLETKRLISLWNRLPSAGLKKMICAQTRGLLSLCKEDWYSSLARREVVDFLLTTDEIRKYIYPFVFRHDVFRTKVVLTLFVFSPVFVKRWILRRLCCD